MLEATLIVCLIGEHVFIRRPLYKSERAKQPWANDQKTVCLAGNRSKEKRNKSQTKEQRKDIIFI